MTDRRVKSFDIYDLSDGENWYMKKSFMHKEKIFFLKEWKGTVNFLDRVICLLIYLLIRPACLS